MQFTRLWIGQQTDGHLRVMARLGLRPNLICRLGFCLSLQETDMPDPKLYEDGQVREFNCSTLFGQWDALFVSILKQYLSNREIDTNQDLEPLFRAHISRGVRLLSTRVTKLSDLGNLLKVAYPNKELNSEENNNGEKYK
jgi:DNA sulfur modification protein DndE